MSNGDYFFLIFLAAIVLMRVITALRIQGLSLGNFRLRHYMYGLVLALAGFLIHNLTIFAVGLGWFVDELQVILAKGPGHKEESWNGCEDYHTPWSVAGTLILILITFVFRDVIVGLI